MDELFVPHAVFFLHIYTLIHKVNLHCKFDSLRSYHGSMSVN